MKSSELDFDLPDELVAQRPAEDRSGARLMLLDRKSGAISHHHVRDLPQLLAPHLIVFNDTRVIPARLAMKKPTGGRAELLLVEREHDNQWLAMGRGLKGLTPGSILDHERTAALRAKLLEKRADGLVRVELFSEDEAAVSQLLETWGDVPLPPYIKRPAAPEDRSRYQTVFAQNPGAAAAPTAGLHFTPELLQQLEESGSETVHVTLHVGLGTFAPLKTDDLANHAMHEERFNVPDRAAAAYSRARATEKPILAVGTTVVRTLESVLDAAGRTIRAGENRTRIFLYPPMAIRSVDALFTNFHTPRSTLLALVMAFGGIDFIREAYRVAVIEKYRFFSYGDAMLIV